MEKAEDAEQALEELENIIAEIVARDLIKLLELFQGSNVHDTWFDILFDAFNALDTNFKQRVLYKPNKYLPTDSRLFSAFSMPLTDVKFILFGESPYPRPESANGYAFWDNKITSIWSVNGLSKDLNRATSLRNIIKTALVAKEKLILSDLSQPAIAAVDKTDLAETCSEVFLNLINDGVLLLNASLTLFEDTPVQKQGKEWLPFVNNILLSLSKVNPNITLVLFGNIAKVIENLEVSKCFNIIACEHPYNLSFIKNMVARDLMCNWNLLNKPNTTIT